MDSNPDMSPNYQHEGNQPKSIKVDVHGRAYGTGKRKEAVARVWLAVGKGNVTVNGMDLFKYFKKNTLCRKVYNPFIITSTSGCYNVIATVKGGGISGQAGAVAHGISKALADINPSLHAILRSGGLLTRDSRVVERKKYGQHKARKSCQFSKR
ncbi:30S ribosomal protein S9 [Ehrlichia ruminantium]|uniref:Small ribosomal subunit protein uS9 n=1 Tax=Ehrlichia ruminantium TaxID=779 RepID=A0A170TG62_EHRRU|nr:30S ribosomal protein S9 [Ehrlichia ruminantium]GAT75708.1 30S ribosomal protein S9 [Ehrlichia ruminantium]GAT77678.1 30S ribosomal protein S9 [Ehrlichia ruminantium]GAT78848.1 30S ribosomal protein S9 [Ehrlichia ruminantium]